MKITPLVLTVITASLFLLSGCKKDNKNRFYFNATINGSRWEGIDPRALSPNEITADGEFGDAISLRLHSFTPGNYTFRFWPATLINFSVQVQQQEVHIEWETTAEANTNHFEIERSDDGLSWASIHTEPAAGSAHAYHVVKWSSGLSQNTNYYFRLKLVDNDGRISYSPVEFVIIEYTALYKMLNGEQRTGYNGNIEIISVDETERIMSGKFAFKCNSSSGIVYNITNGEFRIEY
jgi:hypothetical protein